ncbi:hypothetical protein [Engelhardtia mirabilis]|uniref:hypothetical protein n=1 Tax=Engelhardtia mirabilis TaxID=2528011 RepID=UPI00119EF800
MLGLSIGWFSGHNHSAATLRLPEVVATDSLEAVNAGGLRVAVDAHWMTDIVARARSRPTESLRADVAALRSYLEDEASRELDRLHVLGDSHLLAHADKSGDLPRIIEAQRRVFDGLPELVEARAVRAADGTAEYRLAVLDRARYGPLWDVALELRLLESVLDERP